MKVNPISTNQIEQKKQKNYFPNFLGKLNLDKYGYEILDSLEKKGIQSVAFGGPESRFVLNCIDNVVKIFEDAFPHLKLPGWICPMIAEKENDAYGMYIPDGHMVEINTDLDCFKDQESLEQEMRKTKNVFFLPDEKSTTHYLRTFVHEFGHNAHHRNLENNGQGDAIYVFQNMRIPNILGRFIAKFKLGKYSAHNMAEFMAERIAKDICSRLFYFDMTGRELCPIKPDYSNIFSNKWNCRYITPQSYLDYYTQQVWNGDIEGAGKVLKKMEEYMIALEKGYTISAVEIERPKSAVSLKQDSFIGKLDKFFGGLFSTPKSLDNDNKLEINVED